MMIAAGGLLGGCAEVDDQAPAKDPVAIQLTATVEGETALPGNVAAWTRADADGSEQASHESQICLDFTPKADAPSLGVAVGSSQSDNAAITGSAFAEGSALGVSATTGSAPAGTRGIQKTSIANGQTVYLWADKGSAGTYTFLQAWELTSDGSGSLSGSTKYYPSDGAALTFRAVHGNFSSVPTSSTAVSTALTHSVATDQNSGSNYQLSDLMYGEGSGSYQSTGTVAFTHKLSKIEVNLTPGIGITASDIASAVVKVRYVKPTVTITPNNGTVSSASGTATTITAHRNGTLHEAVLPPQAAPDGVLSVTINGITATIPNAVTTFAAGNKYVYNVTCTNKDKRLNPLWYVAENNVKSYNSSTKVVTLETNPAAAGSSYCYNWNDAMLYFSRQGAATYNEYWAGDITDGSTSFKYHLPCQLELFSILPTGDNVFDASAFMSGGGKVSSAQTCIFGYNSDTQGGIGDWSYWSAYSTTNLRYALRYLGTPYCSVWKYQFSGSVLTITAKLIDYIAADDASLSTKLSSYMNKGDSWWNSNDENEGAIQRKFYAIGLCNSGTGTANSTANQRAFIWSTTEGSPNTGAYTLYFISGRLDAKNNTAKTNGQTVRLFRNIGVGEGRTAVNPLTLNLGDIIYDDCTVTANNAYNSSKHAIGVVVYKASSAEAACEAGVETQHGSGVGTVVGRVLVMALEDISGTMAVNNNSSHNTSLFPRSEGNTSTASNDFKGYAKTKQMATVCTSHSHYAATAAWNYTPSNATTTTYLTGSTGWFLPSIGQWMKVFQAMASAAGVSTTIPAIYTTSGNGSSASKLKTYITNAGGNASKLVVNESDYSKTNFYASSSDGSANMGQHVSWSNYSNFGFRWGFCQAGELRYVRPFLAY